MRVKLLDQQNLKYIVFFLNLIILLCLYSPIFFSSSFLNIKSINRFIIYFILLLIILNFIIIIAINMLIIFWNISLSVTIIIV